MADAHLFLKIYEVRRDGKLLSTKSVKNALIAKGLRPIGIAKGPGRLDYRETEYRAP
jgi:hypothetical protein